MERRNFISSCAASATAIALAESSALKNTSQPTQRWQYGTTRWPICLDTSTLSKDIGLAEKVELAAKAGFDAIEPWDYELKNHLADGASLVDLGKRIRDLGMFVPSVIGLWGALAPTKEIFNSEIDQHKECLDRIAAIGSEHVQVIPKFNRQDALDHRTASWAYAQICAMAKQYNLKPAVIFLNFVKGLERLSDAARIAMDSGVDGGKIIPDTYHMFLSGSPVSSLNMLNGNAIAIFQFADAGHNVQASNARGLDGRRVLPGDGKLPLTDYLNALKLIGYKGCISLELYNKEYRKRAPAPFLEEALRKTVAVVASVH